MNEYSIIGLCIFLFGILLFRFFKHFIYSKNVCKFKLSRPIYRIDKKKKYANFTVTLLKDYIFFKDFPVSFKFFSNAPFKSKIKISYSAFENEKSEEIINRNIIFETKIDENIYYISDIIIGEINIEIEVLIYYGIPKIQFEILKNSICECISSHVLNIKFPK